ncbi:MAG: methyltransferase [Rhizobiaceae bacterium]
MNIETSLDGFLDNSFKVIQPANGAHRSGLDALLVAATIPQEAKGHVADFGAGCGVAGMAVAQRCDSLTVDLIEIDKSQVELATRSLALPENRHLAPSINVIEADLMISGEARSAAGLIENSYDFIIANPPYNTNARQTSPNSNRARAHAMEQGMFGAWLKTAAALAKPKATIAVIMRPETLGEALSSMAGRFGSVQVLPIHPKQHDAANRVILLGKQGGKAPLQLLPALVVHQRDGSFTPKAEAIFRGHEGLFA